VSRSIDVDSYFRRIGYSGPRDPTLETLKGIHLHHPVAIPFENLDPLLKRSISLDSQALQGKLIHGGRGGWCFEHNWLLMDVLRALGFRVTGLAARVMWNAPEGAVRPRTHMLVRIDGLEGGPYLADVGFGGMTLTGPLRLIADVEQPTPHERFRLLEIPGGYVVQARFGGNWKSLYNFDLQAHVLPDYEVWNWYLEHHPDSPFTHSLRVARVTPEGRYGLLNNKLTLHRLGAQSVATTLNSAAELRHTLVETIGIKLPDEPGLEDLLTRLAHQPASFSTRI
jgi:N-hydroxyarylamine O-acetyltransferase